MDRIAVTNKVIMDLAARSEVGRLKYGEVLTTNNGRNMLRDAYEESLDMAQYLKGELIEKEEFCSKVKEILDDMILMHPSIPTYAYEAAREIGELLNEYQKH